MAGQVSPNRASEMETAISLAGGQPALTEWAGGQALAGGQPALAERSRGQALAGGQSVETDLARGQALAVGQPVVTGRSRGQALAVGQPALAERSRGQAVRLNPSEREQQILAFLPIAKCQALRIAARLQHQVDAQDLMHAGVLGLLDALEKYDTSKGTQLKTYAEFRIRGAMLDEMRAMDWASRSTRKKIKRIREAYGQLERELQQEPSEEQVAESMGLDMEAFHSLVMETQEIGLVSMEDLFHQGKKCNGELQEWRTSEDPHDSYEWKEMRSKVLEALQGLPERERLVVTLYYYEELTMREIGMALGVTESRVSQIHAQVLQKLKDALTGVQ